MKYPAESLRRDEVLALLAACGDTYVGRRNKALIVVLWRAGLRLAEALALKPYDIDHEMQTIRVMHGKGDKARTVAIHIAALRYLSEWIGVRTKFVRGNSVPITTPVFCTRDGKVLQQQYVRALLPRLAKKAGVHRRVHAHALRHTFAVELVREGVPMIHIQRLLGHTSLNTTATYSASLSPEEALDSVRGRPSFEKETDGRQDKAAS